MQFRQLLFTAKTALVHHRLWLQNRANSASGIRNFSCIAQQVFAIYDLLGQVGGHVKLVVGASKTDAQITRDWEQPGALAVKADANAAPATQRIAWTPIL
jgi:hypothetical protein